MRLPHVRIERRPHRGGGRRSPAGRRGAALVAGGAFIVGGLAVTASSPAQQASATASIQILIKSVTVSATRLAYAHCAGGHSARNLLGFPNGSCQTAAVIVTNGDAPATILVTGSDAVPRDGGRPWTLCGGGVVACTGRLPGVDQFSEQDHAVQLSTRARCDLNFAPAPCGGARPHQAAAEVLKLVGPRSSTDRSPSFTTQVSWTAN